MQNNFPGDRRRFPRYEINIPVNRIDLGQQQLSADANTHDISERGLGLVLDKELKKATDLLIELEMPDNSEKITLKGRAVWIQTLEEGRSRAGIELLGENIKPIPMVLRILLKNVRVRAESAA